MKMSCEHYQPFYQTSEQQPCAGFKPSQFPARRFVFRCRPVSSPPPGKWPSEKPFPRWAVRNPVPHWRTCPPHSLSGRWSSASSCPEGHYPGRRQYRCHANVEIRQSRDTAVSCSWKEVYSVWRQTVPCSFIGTWMLFFCTLHTYIRGNAYICKLNHTKVCPCSSYYIT